MIIIIIAITTVISIISFGNRELMDKLKFNAWYVKHENQYWRLISYALVHADWIHLIINMYVFYSFGRIVEVLYKAHFGDIGTFYFIILYVGGAFFATMYDYAKQKDNALYNAVGASGAVAAVTFASIILYPQGRIYLFFLPIPIPSTIFGILYLIYSWQMAKRGRDNIGHYAHFWGAVFGIVFTVVLKPALALQFIYNIF